MCGKSRLYLSIYLSLHAKILSLTVNRPRLFLQSEPGLWDMKRLRPRKWICLPLSSNCVQDDKKMLLSPYC
jgi:hypothetical protein